MRKEKHYIWVANLTDAENERMKGKVKDVMITTYKAHVKSKEVIQGKIEVDSSGLHYNSIITYSRNGYRMRIQTFGSSGNYDKTKDDKRRLLKEIRYINGELYSTHIYEYMESDGLTETKVTNGDGSIFYRTVDKLDNEGKQIEHFQYDGNTKEIGRASCRERV